MRDIVAKCPQCGESYNLGARVGAKLGAAVLGALVGHRAFEHWLGALVGMGVGAALGHIVDTEILPECPTCRVALQVAEVIL